MAGARWGVSDDWDSEGAVQSHGSEAGETWDCSRGGCNFGRCSAEDDCCTVELVVIARSEV